MKLMDPWTCDVARGRTQRVSMSSQPAAVDVGIRDILDGAGHIIPEMGRDWARMCQKCNRTRGV